MKLLNKVLSFLKPKAAKIALKNNPVHFTREKRQRNIKRRILGAFSVILLFVFCALILSLSIRGHAGNPTAGELNQSKWKDDGPLELSPERGRYALLYAMTETKSFFFTPDIARFATPDVAYKDGHFVSLFAPGVSYIVIPGYMIGKAFGHAQIGTFAMIALFAIANFFFIRAIAIRMGAHSIAATLGGFAFLFASPAFAYAVTLYQHHISTFLILASLYLLLRFRSALSLMAIWLMCGISIAVDYPNFFMMFPIGVVALARSVVVEKAATLTNVSIHIARILAISAVILPLVLFLGFNKASYGSPFTLSGSVERSIEVKPNGQPYLETDYRRDMNKKNNEDTNVVLDKSLGVFFQPRLILGGLYTHFFSLDRGMVLYAPVLFFGIFGMFFLKRHKAIAALLGAVIGFNVLMYSMWGDPYGGWAFGSRYLIPTYAMLGITIGILLTRWNKQIIFIILFFMMFSYSVGVNTLGAITSNRNPPQVEAVALEQSSGIKQEYTFARNLQVLDAGISKSYVYQTYAAKYMTPRDYYTYLTAAIILVASILMGVLTGSAFRQKEETKTAEIKARLVQRRRGRYAI